MENVCETVRERIKLASQTRNVAPINAV